jgi:hypothetical protein
MLWAKNLAFLHFLTFRRLLKNPYGTEGPGFAVSILEFRAESNGTIRMSLAALELGANRRQPSVLV